MLTDEVRFSMRTDKHLIEPFGIDEGMAGGKGSCIINPGSEVEKRLPSRFGDQRLSKNNILRLERPGGGGLGHPWKRPADQVLEDVRQGYVSVGKAKADYGVVIDSSSGLPVLNEPETRNLRGSAQKNSGKKKSPLL